MGTTPNQGKSFWRYDAVSDCGIQGMSGAPNVPAGKNSTGYPDTVFKMTEILEFSYISDLSFVQGRLVLKIQKLHISRRITRPFNGFDKQYSQLW